MAKKVTRKVDEFKVYPETDTDGSITLPETIGELMIEAEELIYESALMNEHDQGVYFAVNELLSCPLGLIEDKAMELIADIIDKALATDEDEDEEIASNENAPPFDIETHTKGDKMHSIGQPPVQGDISDEELEAEFTAQEQKEKEKKDAAPLELTEEEMQQYYGY